MSEYVNKKDVIDILRENRIHNVVMWDVVKCIKNICKLPSINISTEENGHRNIKGEWREVNKGNDVIYECPFCGAQVHCLYDENFCFRCGADLRSTFNEYK